MNRIDLIKERSERDEYAVAWKNGVVSYSAPDDIKLILNYVQKLEHVLKAAIVVRDGYNVFIGEGMAALEEALAACEEKDE